MNATQGRVLDVVGLVREFLPELDAMTPETRALVENGTNLYVAGWYLEHKETCAVVCRESDIVFCQWQVAHPDASLEERLAHAMTPEQRLVAHLIAPKGGQP